MLRDFSAQSIDLRNKSVLVTGATGSFGSAFVKHCVEKLGVGRIVIFSRDELKQFEMQQLYPHSRHPEVRFFIGDVRDEERVKRATRGVDIIVHAAALKQVIAMEYNPTECVETNIRGAENIVRAALQNQVKRVVALSTDKAAEPVNLYGASKLVSDKIFVAANNLATKTDPIFSVVRYGNVLNSRGSVVPYFRKLLSSGAKTLPVTDERMTRFIITLQQGVDFVCKSLNLMRGGEIFVPKIPSLRVVDLIEAMSPGCDREVVGIRPGEKIHEMLIPSATARTVVKTDDFFMICPEFAYRAYEPPRELNLNAVDDDEFSYNSRDNDEYLSVLQIRELLSLH